MSLLRKTGKEALTTTRTFRGLLSEYRRLVAAATYFDKVDHAHLGEPLDILQSILLRLAAMAKVTRIELDADNKRGRHALPNRLDNLADDTEAAHRIATVLVVAQVGLGVQEAR